MRQVKMNSKKFIAVFTAVCMLLTFMPMSVAAAETEVTETAVNSPAFQDVTGHWGQTAIEKWSGYGIINGYNGQFRPDDSITRGEMAVILDNLMDYQVAAENKFSDLPSGQFYTEAILKANAAGIIKGDGATVRPLDKITREESAVMMSRAFAVAESGSAMSFSDASVVAAWAKGAVTGMEAKGYVSGYAGKFDPKANITRAAAVTMINNIVKAYYTKAGTYTENVDGTAIIKVTDVVLKGVTISGNLIIAEGVAQGDATLDNVTVKGEIIARGGGENSIHIIGNSSVTSIRIEKVGDKLRIVVADGITIKVVEVAVGEEIIITGNVGTLEVSASDAVVYATAAEITSATISGDSSTIIVGAKSTINSITVDSTADNAAIKTETGSVVKAVEASATVDVTGTGTVSTVTLKTGADGSSVTTPKTVVPVATGVTGVTGTGGTAIPAGSSGTNGNTATAPATIGTAAPVSSGGGGGGGTSTVTEELTAAKATAKAEADALLDGLTAADYTAASWKAFTDAIAADKAAIDEKTTVAEVTGYILTGTAAKAALVTLAAELAAAKAEAKGVLTTELGKYKETDYSASNWTTLNKAKTDGDSAIEVATDTTGVTAAKEAALAVIDARAAALDVKNLGEFKAALANGKVEEIRITADFESAEKVLISRPVSIDGGGKAITFTGNAIGWQGNYVLQVYNTTGVAISNLKLTGADGALLVNGSEVELTGTIDVSGNEFGGIEVSKGAAAGLNNSKLTVTGTLLNTTEAYGLPTVWIDKAGGTVTGGTFTENATVKTNQVQFYLNAANAVNPAIAVTGVKLSSTTYRTAENGEPFTLTATASPTDATNKSITWSSNNEMVAMVADGVVTPKAAGTATITVTTADGSFTATCIVTVVKATATVNGVGYTTLNLAISKAPNGATVTVQQNTAITSGIMGRITVTGKAITIDLNGHEVVSNDASTSAFRISPTGQVTFTDSSGTNAGQYKNLNTISNTLTNEGTLIINGGTIGASTHHAIVMASGSKTTITGGIVNGYIASNGTYSNVDLTISGGTFNQTLYLPAANSVTTISGGTFTPIAGALSAIEIDAGTLNISGGTFTNNIDTASNSTAVANTNGSGAFKGVIVAVKPSTSSSTAYGSAVMVNLTGGTFTNTLGDAVVLADQTASGNTGGGTITVTIGSAATITGAAVKYDSEPNVSTLN